MSTLSSRTCAALTLSFAAGMAACADSPLPMPPVQTLSPQNCGTLDVLTRSLAASKNEVPVAAGYSAYGAVAIFSAMPGAKTANDKPANGWSAVKLVGKENACTIARGTSLTFVRDVAVPRMGKPVDYRGPALTDRTFDLRTCLPRTEATAILEQDLGQTRIAFGVHTGSQEPRILEIYATPPGLKDPLGQPVKQSFSLISTGTGMESCMLMAGDDFVTNIGKDALVDKQTPRP